MSNDIENNMILSDLKDVIERYKQLNFTPEAIEEGEVKDTQVLGCLISDYLDYNSEEIFEMSTSAFEDINYHIFNDEFKKLWSNYR